MSGEHEPWVFRGGLIADLQVCFILEQPTKKVIGSNIDQS